jgi:hypothetical protein
METQKQQHAPCESTPIRTRKHCTCYFENPDGRGCDIRCRNRAVYECEHGLQCAECYRWVHEVHKRHPGDFCCVICSKHFHDRESQDVHDHIAECTNRSAVARGMEPPFPVKSPIKLIGALELSQMFQDILRGKQN